MDKGSIIVRFHIYRLGTGSQSINYLTTLPLFIAHSTQVDFCKPLKHQYIFLIPVRVK